MDTEVETQSDEAVVVARKPYDSLSPSRAADFKNCPLLFRFRVLDRLPEVPSPAAVRGTVVHKVLEDLFDLPASERTPEQASTMVAAAWEQVQAAEPDRTGLFLDGDSDAERTWLDTCRAVLARYFELEDPRVLEPAERELEVEAFLEDGLRLRGIVDRVDIAADGAIRINDYKTGASPGERYEAQALFQLRFYALVIYRMRGVVPALLRLLYLGNAETISYAPDLDDLRATERTVIALRDAIEVAHRTGDWQPQRSMMCSWCSFKPLCPEYGGTPPPLPDGATPAEMPEFR